MSVRKIGGEPGVWMLDFRDSGGKRRQLRFRGTEAEALELEHSYRIARRAAKPLGRCPMLAEAAPDYLEHYRLDHLDKGIARQAYSIRHLLRHLGNHRFPSITPELVEQYKKARLAEGVTPSTINKELAALSGFCRWANERGYCERLHIRRFPAKMSRAPLPNVPTRKQVVQFLRALPRRRRGMWAAMFYCGLRVSEARGLRDGDVHWGRGVLLVTGKGNKQRVVPIHRKLRPYLRRALPFEAPLDLRAAAEWAAKRAGLDLHIHPHLMRHAFGVHMIQSGVSLRAVQEMMGHSSSAVTEIYTRLAAEWLVEEMKKG